MSATATMQRRGVRRGPAPRKFLDASQRRVFKSLKEQRNFDRLTPSDVQPGDPILSGFSVDSAQNSSFVGMELFAVVPVPKDEGSFYKWGQANHLRREDTLRAPGGKYSRSSPSLTKVSFATLERGHEAELDADTRDNADDSLNLDKQHSEYATAKVMLDFEHDAAALVQASGSYASGHTTTLSGTSRWSDLVNSNPIGNVETGKETVRSKIGRYPDTMLMSAAVRSKLVQHSQILGRLTNVQRTGTGDITDALLASIFGVSRIVVASPIEITSPEGATVTYADMWNDTVSLLVTDEPNEGTKNFGVTWSRWGTEVFITEMYYEENKRVYVFRTRAKYDFDVISNISGYAILDTLA